MIQKITTLLLFLSISFTGISQEKVYLDADMKEVDAVQFKSLCKNKAFKCLEYASDSILVNKVLPKYSFGKITPEAYNQLRSILALDSKTTIQPDANIIIQYSDSLFNKETLIKTQMALFKGFDTSNGNKLRHVSNGFAADIITDDSILTKQNLERFNMKKSKYVEKCIEKLTKQDLVSIHLLYHNKQDGFIDFENFSRMKDRGIFKNTFFKIYKHYRLLILKPDGEYFLSGSYISNKNTQQLLKHEDWSTYKSDLKVFEETGCYANDNFFEDPVMNLYTKHCFE